MDWTAFMLGAFSGSTFTLLLFSLLAWRWMRPFMRAAQRKAEQAASGQSLAWKEAAGLFRQAPDTSNEPNFVWPQQPKAKRED